MPQKFWVRPLFRVALFRTLNDVLTWQLPALRAWGPKRYVSVTQPIRSLLHDYSWLPASLISTSICWNSRGPRSWIGDTDSALLFYGYVGDLHPTELSIYKQLKLNAFYSTAHPYSVLSTQSFNAFLILADCQSSSSSWPPSMTG